MIYASSSVAAASRPFWRRENANSPDHQPVAAVWQRCAVAPGRIRASAHFCLARRTKARTKRPKHYWKIAEANDALAQNAEERRRRKQEDQASRGDVDGSKPT